MMVIMSDNDGDNDNGDIDDDNCDHLCEDASLPGARVDVTAAVGQVDQGEVVEGRVLLHPVHSHLPGPSPPIQTFCSRCSRRTWSCLCPEEQRSD